MKGVGGGLPSAGCGGSTRDVESPLRFRFGGGFAFDADLAVALKA